MNKIILLAAAGCLFMSCGKNKGFPSTPQITFKSIYPGVYQSGGGTDSISIICGFKDAEGDIQNQVFYKQESSTIDPNLLIWDSLPMPNFPPRDNLEGNIIVILHSNQIFIPPNPGVADTTYFSIYMKDKAGHISDTIKTSTILLYQ